MHATYAIVVLDQTARVGHIDFSATTMCEN